MRGFTFLELLITLTIVMILCGLAVPSFQTMIGNIHADMAIIQLYRAIQLTRSEAIKANSIATICPSKDGYQCQTDWSTGYLVFVDKEGSGQVEADDPLIHFFKPIKGGGLIVWKNFRNKNYLQMTSMGYPNSQNGTFIYSSKEGNSVFTRKLMINISGRLRIEKK